MALQQKTERNVEMMELLKKISMLTDENFEKLLAAVLAAEKEARRSTAQNAFASQDSAS